MYKSGPFLMRTVYLWCRTPEPCSLLHTLRCPRASSEFVFHSLTSVTAPRTTRRAPAGKILRAVVLSIALKVFSDNLHQLLHAVIVSVLAERPFLPSAGNRFAPCWYFGYGLSHAAALHQSPPPPVAFIDSGQDIRYPTIPDLVSTANGFFPASEQLPHTERAGKHQEFRLSLH
jgi:hypothetical protein